MRNYQLIGIFIVGLIVLGFYIYIRNPFVTERSDLVVSDYTEGGDLVESSGELHPLSIESLRQREYDSNIKIEQKLSDGSNYERFIASYSSDGYKVYGLLTVPKTKSGSILLPAIVFNHGYIPPDEYRTLQRYVAYVDYLARNGYVVFKIDYRGHGDSEGQAEGGYGSNAYVIDSLNAVSALSKLSYVNKNSIGMWGHSMGGWVSTRAAISKPDMVKAVVVWGGVLGSYQDLVDLWWSRRPTPVNSMWQSRGKWRQSLIDQYGPISDDNSFWQSVSTVYYLKDLQSPIQLHHSKGDSTVPYQLSEKFAENLEKLGKVYELYLYEGDNHNISVNFSTAMKRTVEFFDKYLKQN
ncbi:MAG: hypothetical protein KatS3mg091_867 [Patescibacteria group bacterium]|nr:MAG: hypothetical protein KatS3mg091_867 [Patescibacteria group bacterium]